MEGPDDFASMKEVISRRMSRLINENKELPDLLIVDGGKGQLSSAVEALDETELKISSCNWHCKTLGRGVFSGRYHANNIFR